LVQRRRQFEKPALDELESLAKTAGYNVVGRLEQVREPDARYQIGAGKVEELTELVKKNAAEKVIFDNLLRPLQSYNLAKATNVEAIDRFQLILEIFTRRATTAEANLQIRLARLQYNLTQAKERVRLAKRGEQPGFMGLGAYEVDVYYESVKKEVHAIRRKLKTIRRKRVLHRERRAELGYTTISLAGYTKAGKSCLFNSLADETVQVDSSLFTTLSTTTRLVMFSKRRFLLTDTVGFIDRLPLTLIEAFRSTLEETIYSDLVLLMVDASEAIDVMERKLNTCVETIDRIGASGVPTITVLNKIDLISDDELQRKIESLRDKAMTLVPISALRGTNIDLLQDEIMKQLRDYVRVSFTARMTKQTMSFMAWLFDNANVKTAEYESDSVHVVFESSPAFAEKVGNRVKKEFDGKVEKL
jgi:GTP-binding protein HflX